MHYSWWLCLLALVLAVTAIRTIVHDHQTDRALMPWAWCQVGAGAVCVFAGWATMPF